MSSPVGEIVSVTTPEVTLEGKVRQRIEGLSYLPTTAGVAIKFIELGRDPEADPADYAKVISADSSLSSKLISLANSSWFGVRNKVHSVRVAVNLLGLGTVRTLAISYCMAGLHNELRLSPEESRMFWESSLCKAVAAREYARKISEKLADEAFAAALFQDFALPVMYTVAGKQYQMILEDGRSACRIQLEKERDLFHLDHAEIGRILAQRMDLPDFFIQAVAFHHQPEQLRALKGNPVLPEALFLAALLPHRMNVWNNEDLQLLQRFWAEPRQVEAGDLQVFLDEVQIQIDKLFHYFQEGDAPQVRLGRLMEQASREAADNTTQLVGTLHQMIQEAVNLGMEVNQVLRQNNELREKAARDALTGALNREAFQLNAGRKIAEAHRYQAPYSLVFLDIDKFKTINDRMGHAFGDLALQKLVAIVSKTTRKNDLVARLGGDEFALLIEECREAEVRRLLERIYSGLSKDPVSDGVNTMYLTVSAGILHVCPSRQTYPLEHLLGLADQLMYKAKKAGGARYFLQTL